MPMVLQMPQKTAISLTEADASKMVTKQRKGKLQHGCKCKSTPGPAGLFLSHKDPKRKG
jgi:hypothetical protein